MQVLVLERMQHQVKIYTATFARASDVLQNRLRTAAPEALLIEDAFLRPTDAAAAQLAAAGKRLVLDSRSVHGANCDECRVAQVA